MTKISANVIKIVKSQCISDREIECIELLIGGLSNKAIGNMLGITEKTVKFNFTNIYRKLNVKSRMELFRLILDWHSK